MADCLILVFAIVAFLLLLTAFDRYYELPCFNPSTFEAQKLLVALEDLLLPLGSLPAKVLHPWFSAGENDDVEPSTTPAPTRSKLDGAEYAQINASPPLPDPVSDDDQSLGSKQYADKLFFDRIKHQLTSDLDTIATKMPLSKQKGADVDLLNRYPTTVAEKEEQQEKEDITAAVEDTLMENRVFEKAIRDLIDPEGRYAPDHQQIIKLVAATIEGRKEAEGRLGSETVRLQREKEDQRHDWDDSREAFEHVINGQNKKMQSTQQDLDKLTGLNSELTQRNNELTQQNNELTQQKKQISQKHDELSKKNDRLSKENDEVCNENAELSKENHISQGETKNLKEKRQLDKDQYNQKLSTLKAEKESAEQTAAAATAEADHRINVVKENHEKEKEAAALKNSQEQNTLICSRKNKEDELKEAVHQAKMREQQHKDEMDEGKSTIKDLSATVRQLRSDAEKTAELGVSADRRQQKQLNDQRKKNDDDIARLNDQLRKSEDTVKIQGEWKTKEEGAQRNCQTLSDRLNEEMTSLREDKEHVVASLKLDIQGLERTIATNEAQVEELVGTIARLEAGEQVQGLQSQLGEAQNQAKDQERKRKVLQSIIKSRDKKIKEDAENSTKEKESLEKQLEEARGFGEEAQKLKGEKEALSRTLEITKDTEQKLRTELQGFENEKKRTTTECQKAMEEKDEKIGRLGQTVEEAKETVDANAKEPGKEVTELTTAEEGQREEEKRKDVEDPVKRAAEDVTAREEQHEKARKEAVENAVSKAAEEAEIKEEEYKKDKKEAVEKAVRKAAEDAKEKGEQHEKGKKEAVEKAAKEAAEAASKKEEQHEKDKKEAVEKAVKEAEEAATQTLQKKLDVETISSREALEKASQTESDLRAELRFLKSQVEPVEEPKIVDPNRQIRIPRGPKGRLQPGPSLPLSSSPTLDQPWTYVGKPQQPNGAGYEEYDPRSPHLINLHQNVKPQSSAAKSEKIPWALAPTQASRAANGSVSQTQDEAMTDSTPAQWTPEPAGDGNAFVTPQYQENGFDLSAIDISHPAWAGVNFSKQNGPAENASATQSTIVPQGNGNAATPSAQRNTSSSFLPGKPAPFDPLTIADTSTDAPSTPKNKTSNGAAQPPVIKRDNRQPFADILAALQLPVTSSSANKAPAVAAAPVPKPVTTPSRVVRNNAAPPEPKTPPQPITPRQQQSPLPGLQFDTNEATTDSDPPLPTFNRPKNPTRQSRLNAGRQQAHKAFALTAAQTASSSSSSSPPNPSSQLLQQGPKLQPAVVPPQQGTFDFSSPPKLQQQQQQGPDQQQQQQQQPPAGWTSPLTTAVTQELRQNNYVAPAFLADVLRLNHDFDPDDFDPLYQYLETLRGEVKGEKVRGEVQGEKVRGEVKDEKARGEVNDEKARGEVKDDKASGEAKAEKMSGEVTGQQGTAPPPKPPGWTDALTDTVREMLLFDDDIVFVEEVVKEELDLRGWEKGGLERWLGWVQAEWEREGEEKYGS